MIHTFHSTIFIVITSRSNSSSCISMSAIFLFTVTITDNISTFSDRSFSSFVFSFSLALFSGGATPLFSISMGKINFCGVSFLFGVSRISLLSVVDSSFGEFGSDKS